jgi:ankyrin repeat protein
MNSTDMHAAAEAGDLEKVNMLLTNNADLVSNKDTQGCTPLHLAAMEGHDAVVELLMANTLYALMQSNSII